jgi:site-specific recombinase XerD
MNSILEAMLIKARRENPTEYLFPSYARGDREDKEIRPMLDIKRSFQTAKREAMKFFPQLRSMTFHSFRHASAVMAWNNGASGAAIQQMLGHKSWRTTDIYLQTISASLKQASDILGRGFGDLSRIKGTRGAHGRFLESAASR